MSERWTQERVRGFALSLPETGEGSHFGRPGLRVRGRLFGTLSEDGRSVNLRTTPLGMDMLVRSGDGTYTDVWASRWVGVALERVDPEELRELIVEAYCLAAPKKLAAGARALPAAEVAS